MANLSERRLEQGHMLNQIEDVLLRGKPSDPPAYTLILGSGASFGVVPTAKQMLGIPDGSIFHKACIPAAIHEQEHGQPPGDTELPGCVTAFWRRFVAKNAAMESISLGADGLPSVNDVAKAYRAIFSTAHVCGINTPAGARDYLRRVTMGQGGQIRLNGTHFFLASLLSLQSRSANDRDRRGRPLYIGKRPFARTLFTTNFDPLLQVSLQLFQILYYMTDRPDQLSADALHTDDHPALHLFYAHGSVHRPFLANTEEEIRLVRDRNARDLAPYLSTHGVIVLGYSGWDDCLLRALNETTSFANNLYWLARSEISLSPAVTDFLCSHSNVHWVSISDGGEFMATLHNRLCPGMPVTELLENPIRPLRERLQCVDLSGIPAASPDVGLEAAATAVEIEVKEEQSTTPEEFRQQILRLLDESEHRFDEIGLDRDPVAALDRLQHQADLLYSRRDWFGSIELYSKIVDGDAATPELRTKALLRRAYAHLRSSEIGAAIGDYTRVIALPNAPMDTLVTALMNRAFCYAETGHTAEAIADFTRIIDLPGRPVRQLARALSNRGFCHWQARRPADAIKDHTRVLDLPEAPVHEVAKAFSNRGFCYAETERTSEAIADFTASIELPGAPPDHVAIALSHRGLAYGVAGRTAEAIADFTRVIESPAAASDYVRRALVNRAVAYAEAGRPDEAVADYTRLIESHSLPVQEIAKMLYSRGFLYMATGQTAAASKDFTHVIELPLAPSDHVGNALLSRGILHGRVRRVADAIKDFTAVIELPGATQECVAEALLNRGVTNRNTGRIAEAFDDFHRALKHVGATANLKARAQSELQQMPPPASLPDSSS